MEVEVEVEVEVQAEIDVKEVVAVEEGNEAK